MDKKIKEYGEIADALQGKPEGTKLYLSTFECINWFKKRLWHDAKEKPEKDKLVLIELDLNNGHGEFLYCVSSYNGKGWRKIYFADDTTIKFKRWLYIEELTSEE